MSRSLPTSGAITSRPPPHVSKPCLIRLPSFLFLTSPVSYLFRTTGQVLGVSLSGALTQAILAKELGARITGEGAEEVCSLSAVGKQAYVRADSRVQIITSIRQSSTSIRHLSPELQDAATISYQKALHAVFIVCIVLAAVTTLAGMGIREVDMNVEPKKVTADEEEDDI